jgi:23S rRNA pseudouridine1911/1915/1917 synthase
MAKISDLVIHQSNQLIALNKPAGMSVQEDQSGDASLHRIAMAYCKHDLYVIHRIDRPTSGVVVFAKNKKAAAHLTDQWKSGNVVKSYLAVVSKIEGEQTRELTHHIQENKKSNKVRIESEAFEDSKIAHLKYEKVEEIERYELLKVQLKTGRHHQIRAQLAAEGMPIKGDVKYGFRRGNKDRSIHLHAWQLKFTHPVSGQTIHLKADVPDDVIWHAFQSYKNE